MAPVGQGPKAKGQGSKRPTQKAVWPNPTLAIALPWPNPTLAIALPRPRPSRATKNWPRAKIFVLFRLKAPEIPKD